MRNKDDDEETEQERVVILGGAGSVGQYNVQIAKALGYKVVATCSRRTAGLVKNGSGNEVVEYSLNEDEWFEKINGMSGRNFFGVWGKYSLSWEVSSFNANASVPTDIVAKSEALGRKLLTDASTSKKRKCYATTDDGSPMKVTIFVSPSLSYNFSALLFSSFGKTSRPHR